MGILRRFACRDRGQVLIATALLIPVLLGMAAIAVDIGSYADDKRNLQNAADAIALAAAHDMCTPDPADCSNTAAAATTANAYAAKNNIDPSHMTLTFLGGNTAPKVRVSISHNHAFSFMRILGIDSKDVGAAAASVKVSPGGVSGVIPFAVTEDAVNDAGFGNAVPIHEAGGDCSDGNCGSIDLEGSGKANNCGDPASGGYVCDIMHGSPHTICSNKQPNCATGASPSCPGAFPAQCGTDAPSCMDQGPVCPTEPGTGAGPMTALQYRIDHTATNCDTFDEVFTPKTAITDTEGGGELAAAYRGAAGRLFSPALVKPPTKTPVPTDTPTVAPTSTNTPAPTATNTAIPTNTPLGSATPVTTPTGTATSTPTGGGNGTYTINPDCNPWAGPGQCPLPADDSGQACSRRVVVVPIVEGGSFGNGKSDVTITGFALLFINTDANNDPCFGANGGHCDVNGTLVKADISVNAISCSTGAPATCVYDPGSSIQFERLVE